MEAQTNLNRRYKVPKGSKIYEKNKPITELGMLIKGKVAAVSIYGKVVFGSGTVLGLSDSDSDNYIFDYVAEEDCEIFAYGLDENHDTENIIIENKQFSGLMVSTVTRQASVLTSIYDDLVQQCSTLYDALSENRDDYLSYCKKFSVVAGDIEDVEIQLVAESGENVTIERMYYCKKFNDIPLESLKSFFGQNSYVTYYNVIITSKLIKDLNEAIVVMLKYLHKYKDLLIGNDKKDLYYSFSTLALEVGKKGVDISVLLRGVEKIQEAAKEIGSIDKNLIETAIKNHEERLEFLYKVPDDEDENEEEFKLHLSYTKEEIEKAREEIQNSLDHILEYTDFSDEENDMFKRLVTSFGNLKDRGGSDENAVTIRKQITKVFYKVYEQVFFNYVDANIEDTIIEMFLNFGFMDERLLDESQAIDLYYLNKSTGDKRIFMLKDWLVSIYKGKEEPSKNDFDIDYQENLREIKKSQLMTPEQERAYLSDQKGKVKYEIDNMFRSTNKITCGRISTFCPILSKHNLSDDIQRAYVSPERINSIIKNVLKIDYSLFYRECMYDNDKYENNNERIMKEVRPYFILMPNFGSRCIMWQDIVGRKKDTPARFVLSVFSLEDLNELLINNFAKFRWELCKNLQGIRWSDITSKSLTSEYYDYLQFYKKNREISEKAKEKIKLTLQKKGNNFKEVFAVDYAQWVKYEVEGSPRLNSCARAIMFTYCPFPKEIRKRFAENPMYEKIVKRFENNRESKLKRYQNVRTSMLKAGVEPGEEFEKNIEFFEM